MNILVLQKFESFKSLLIKAFIRKKYLHNVLSSNRLDNSSTKEMLINWADHIINCDKKNPIISKKLIDYSMWRDLKNEMYELQKMDIKNILNEVCPFKELKNHIFEFNGNFFGKKIENFHLTHTHRVIYQACKNISRGK